MGDSHRFRIREAFSDNTKKDDTKEENDKINDHEGSKRKVKENHDSHLISYKRATINTIKNDDVEKRKKKIIVQKKPIVLKQWKTRSKEIKETSEVKEEISKNKEEKEIKMKSIKEINDTTKDDDIKN